MPARLARFAVLTAAVAVLLAGCDSKTAEAPTTSTGTPAPSPTAATGTPAATPTSQPTATGTAAVATEVVRYVPPKPDASTTQDGSCFARSAALPWREDTYRCNVANGISDPCFAFPEGALVCDANPTRADAKPFLLRLTGPLPKEPLSAAQIEAGKKNGWLVKLADGTVCGFLTGATGGFNGLRINYGCTDRSSILGDLTPGTIWTARVVTGSVGPSGFTPATDQVKPIATVYQ